MAAQATIQQLVNYYVGLLIIQYRNKPKAQETIFFLASEFLCSAILLDIRDGYNLDDAVGVQLDVIGKYAGIDRYYRELTLIDYFSMPSYTDEPTSPPQYGFETYATFATDNDLNGTLAYGDIVSSNNQLLDSFFRTIIRLKILQNTSNHSDESIDAGIWTIFGASVRPEESGVMKMAYFITSDTTPLINAAIYKKVLPRPMGVAALLVEDVTGDMFGFTDYSGFESPYAYGFSTYADYASLPGQILTYSQISLG